MNGSIVPACWWNGYTHEMIPPVAAAADEFDVVDVVVVFVRLLKR